jgi:uncharacterized DUF497 family protein
MILFEWDEEKYHSNLMKHWIRFEDAQVLWLDPFAIEFIDSESLSTEERFIRIGFNINKGVLFVVFCEREHGEIVRIISARRATKSEKEEYERR